MMAPHACERGRNTKLAARFYLCLLRNSYFERVASVCSVEMIGRQYRCPQPRTKNVCVCS